MSDLCAVPKCGDKHTSVTDLCKAHQAVWQGSPERCEVDWTSDIHYEQMQKVFIERVAVEEAVDEDDIEPITA
jgi:hypothetical protein